MENRYVTSAIYFVAFEFVGFGCFCHLANVCFATETMTVTATGNARSSFEAPMMVSVIDTSAPENQTATSATDLLRHVLELLLMVPDEPTVRM